MFQFLLIVQALIALALVSVILMQRSEGGGLGVGGSSSGLMTARGAADFLTRTTAVLGALFVLNSIVLAALAGAGGNAPAVDTSLERTKAPVNAPAPVVPNQGTVPAAGATPANAPAPTAAPAKNAATGNSAVPLAQ